MQIPLAAAQYIPLLILTPFFGVFADQFKPKKNAIVMHFILMFDKDSLLSYSDEDTYRDAGQGGFEIRTFITAAAAAGGEGDLHFYTAELPIFAVGCTVASFSLSSLARHLQQFFLVY